MLLFLYHFTFIPPRPVKPSSLLLIFYRKPEGLSSRVTASRSDDLLLSSSSRAMQIVFSHHHLLQGEINSFVVEEGGQKLVDFLLSENDFLS